MIPGKSLHLGAVCPRQVFIIPAILLAFISALPLHGVEVVRDVFMRIDQSEDPADTIAGEATAAGYDRWIKATAIGHGFDFLQGEGRGKARLPTLGDFTIIKKADRSTPLLMKAFLGGRPFRKVTVVQTATIDGMPIHAPVRVELEHVTISDVQLSSGGYDRVFVQSADDRPTEEVSFTYDRVKWVYRLRDDEGVETSIEAEYDTLFGSGDPDLDSDFDGVSNSQDHDDDNDRIPDQYELAFGLDPLSDDAELDLDGDGQSNRGEFAAGTAADDRFSRFSISSIELSVIDRSSATVVFPILPMRQYAVLGSTDGLTWEELRKFNVPRDSMEIEAEIAVPVASSTRMLRVSVTVPEP